MSRKKKKMLYIMGVEWDWIFQRPQILALYMQEDYEVTVACPKQIYGKRQQKNTPPQKLVELVQLPLQEKNRLVGYFADKWHRHVLGEFSAYDIIWVGYPLFARYIPKDYQGMVIYDCMDNFEALFPDRREKAVRYVLAIEKQLLERADIVFASGVKLREKMEKTCPGKRIELVRNGCGNVSVMPPQKGEKKEKYVLGYIGTISEWFDSRLIEESLQDKGKAGGLLHYQLAGPIAGHRLIENPAVTYSGVIEHGKLGEYAGTMDCLIMPFVISEIVLYVDPVKLYEYIAWGKCIVASWYPEIDRFRDFVYFYRDKAEYLQLMEELANKGFPAKFTQESQRAFLKENTWENRAMAMKKAIAAKEVCV